MRLEASKADLRERLSRLTVFLVAVLVVGMFVFAWSLEAVIYLALFGAAGFVLARVLAARGEDVPVARGARRRWARGSFRHAAADQPFNTRLGWTEGSEAGGSLPDARDIVPQGKYGVGHPSDTAAGLLFVIATVFSVFRYGDPLAAFLFMGALGLVGFALVRLTRWLRGR